jgi:hypothetical protein
METFSRKRPSVYIILDILVKLVSLAAGVLKIAKSL